MIACPFDSNSVPYRHVLSSIRPDFEWLRKYLQAQHVHCRHRYARGRLVQPILWRRAHITLRRAQVSLRCHCRALLQVRGRQSLGSVKTKFVEKREEKILKCRDRSSILSLSLSLSLSFTARNFVGGKTGVWANVVVFSLYAILGERDLGRNEGTEEALRIDWVHLHPDFISTASDIGTTHSRSLPSSKNKLE